MARTPFPATPDDYRAQARRFLPRFLFDYVDGGAGRERSQAGNRAAFDAVRLRQRVLVDVAEIDTATTLADQPCRLPLALAPVGLAGMMARRGEAQAARAAAQAGAPFTLSTVGICPLAEVTAASGQPIWFQLYMLRDRGVARALLDEAWAAGCRTLVFTVDLARPGMRHRDTRNGLGAHGARAASQRLAQVLTRPRWLWQVGVRGKPHVFGCLAGQVPDAHDLNSFKAWVDGQFDASVGWQDMAWLRERWPGKLLLKGILDVADARQAVAVGADGVVVSNHGGRQLDAVVATLERLPAIVDVVGGDAEVLLDGGVRSGADIFAALALGARGVLIGRPWVWAVAAGGSVALARLLDSLRRELELTMTLTGVTRIADIGRQHLDRWPDPATPHD